MAKSGKGAGRKGPTKLMIVESPAKARTIQKYLGPEFRVEASMGHVRDLPKSRLGVDVDHDFTPRYVVPREKAAVVKKIREAARKAEEIYLATDPDREGEAIAWHLVQAAKLDGKPIRRVVFHEITQGAVQDAVAHPREIDHRLVEAQQARRILDRLVGYRLSPLLWKKVRRGLSAGRVQSVALRLVVEREREIENFVPEEYWTLDAELAKRPDRPEGRFRARLLRIGRKKAELKTKEQALEAVAALEGSAWVVHQVVRKDRLRRPAPPFVTSTLQQEASRKLGFSASQTMRLAQQLYEGIDLGEEGRVGLITYMRTDSPHVSRVAQEEARRFIQERFGEAYLPPRPPVYRAKAKGAQEAHEAIRPTSIFRTPEAVKPYLNRNQFRLYDLIWRRFLASQMAPAVLDTVRVDVAAGSDDPERLRTLKTPPYLFRATGAVIRFPGFLEVYQEGKEEGEEKEEATGLLPPLEVGEALDLRKLIPEQHFTKPPPRYTEASLVRELERRGIGRPSTYAPTLATLQERGYVVRERKSLVPTDLGKTVNDLLVRHFPEVLDYDFTSRMEARLDEIARGERAWVPTLREFYEPFQAAVERAQREMEDLRPPPEEIGEDCPECGAPLVKKHGRFGPFIACSAFPKCRYRRPIYKGTGVTCPRCGQGELVEKRSRKGRIFYSCNRYPECDFAVWQRPLPDPCPHCGGLLTVFGRGGKKARCQTCGREIELSLAGEPS